MADATRKLDLKVTGDADSAKRALGGVARKLTSVTAGAGLATSSLTTLGGGGAGGAALGSLTALAGTAATAIGGVGAAAAGSAGLMTAAFSGVPALFAGIGTAAAAQSEEVKSAFSDLKEEAGAAFEGFGDSFIEPLVGLAEDLMPVIGTVADTIGQLVDTTAPLVDLFSSELIEAIDPVLNALTNMVNAGMGPLKAALDGIGPLVESFTSILNALAPIIEQVGGSLMTSFIIALQEVLAAVQPLLTTLVEQGAPAFHSLVLAMGPLVEQLTNALVPVIERLTPLLPQLMSAFMRIVEALMPLIPLIGKIAAAAAPLLPVFARLVEILLQAVESALRPMIPVIQQLVPILTQFAEGVGTKLANAFAQLLPKLLQLLPLFIEQLMPVMPKIIDAFVVLTESIIPLVPTFVELIAAIAPLLPPTVRLISLFLRLANGVVKTVLIPALEAIVPPITAVIRWVTRHLEPVLSGLMSHSETVSRVVREVFGYIVGAIKNVGEGFIEFGQTVDNIRDDVIAAARNVWDEVTEFFGNMIDGASDKIEDLAQMVSSIPSDVVTWLGDLGSTLWSAGSDLIEGFIDGIGSMFDDVESTLGSLTDSLTSWKGPESRDRELLRRSGQLIIGGLLRGFEDREGEVRDRLGRLTDDIKGSMDLSGVGSGRMGLPGRSSRAGGGGSQTIVVELDGREMARVVGDRQAKEIRVRTGRLGVVSA